MAVFKEKNGAMKAAGYLRGRTSAQIRPGLLAFEQSISLHPQVVRGSGRVSAIERYRFKNEWNVRAAMTVFDGSIRKGGDKREKKLTKNLLK